MKTVAHIYTRYSPSVIHDLHNELQKRIKYRSVLLAEKYVPNARPLFPDTYYFRKIPGGDLSQKIDGIISENSFYKKMAERFFERMLITHNVSLLHAHFGMAGCAVMDLARKRALPLVVTFYGVDGSFCLKDKRWIPRFQKLFTIADRIIVLCDEVKRRIAAFGYPEEKIRLWNCLENIDVYTYAKRPSQRPVNFIIAARFVEKKGYPLLLNAFARLAKDLDDVRLIIMGYGAGREDVARMCGRLGIQDRVTVIPTDTMQDFSAAFKENLSKSHIFVMPSVTAKNGDDEGGPALTLVAAQAAGLPVIATRFPGSERSVIDNVTGVYAEADVDSLYAKMRYLYENPSLWDGLGARASLYVKKEFCTQDQVNKIEAIYGELI